MICRTSHDEIKSAIFWKVNVPQSSIKWTIFIEITHSNHFGWAKAKNIRNMKILFLIGIISTIAKSIPNFEAHVEFPGKFTKYDGREWKWTVHESDTGWFKRLFLDLNTVRPKVEGPNMEFLPIFWIQTESHNWMVL